MPGRVHADRLHGVTVGFQGFLLDLGHAGKADRVDSDNGKRDRKSLLGGAVSRLRTTAHATARRDFSFLRFVEYLEAIDGCALRARPSHWVLLE